MKYNKLNGLIHEKLGSQKELAKKMGVAQSYVSKRLTGKVEMSLNDVSIISEILEINLNLIHVYFFNN